MKNMKKALITVTILLLVAAFGTSAFLIVRYVTEGKKSQERYDQLADQVASATTETTAPTTAPAPTETEAPTETTAPTEPKPIAEYVDLHAQNPDMVGWIQINGTKINYPVMQTPDEPNYYLERDFDKKSNKRGSIYAKEEADINKPSDNITLFGHHMKDGSMFAALKAYEDKSAWDNNPLISFNTLTEYHAYKIFAVFITSADLDTEFSEYYRFVDAANEKEFDDFIAKCKAYAKYDTGITPKYGDKLITLSTCIYDRIGLGYSNDRLVVCAYRID